MPGNPFEKTFAEEYIDRLPYIDGDIDFCFMRIYPNFKIIQKRIPLNFLSKDFNQTYRNLELCGIKFSLTPQNIKVFDYHAFVKRLFPDFDVYDDQQNREGKKGRPDFRLSNNKGDFYIEFKKSYDDIRTSQLIWVAENPNKEVWFLVLGILDINQDFYS